MLRSGTNEQGWNCVGIELKEDLNSVDRNISDPVMNIELRLEEVCLGSTSGLYRE